jgi:hypothetical protein
MNILIIVGCLAAGYWIVSSVMGPGKDITRSKPNEPARNANNTPQSPPQLPKPAGQNTTGADWHLVLDIPRSANRREIDAAYKRRLTQAEADADATQITRIKLAYEAACSSR